MMKKLWTSLLLLVTLVGVLAVGVSATYSGTGADTAPYVVGNATDLADALTNGGYVQLSNDITDATSLIFHATAQTVLDLNDCTLTVKVSGNSNRTEVDSTQGVTIKNGTLNYSGVTDTTASIHINTGAKMTVDDVIYTSSGSALYPEGDATELIVTDSDITAILYAVATNATTDQVLDITLTNSKFTAYSTTGDAYPGDNTGIFINISSKLTITDCEIYGQRQALVVRGGNVNIKDTTITMIADGKYADLHLAGNWENGNEVPSAAVVIGNRHDTSYQYSSDVTFENVDIINQGNHAGEYNVYMYGNSTAGIGATFTVDADSDVGTIIQGGGYTTVNMGADYTISTTTEIPVNSTFVVESGATLTIEDGATLTNSGTVEGTDDTSLLVVDGTYSSYDGTYGWDGSAWTQVFTVSFEAGSGSSVDATLTGTDGTLSTVPTSTLSGYTFKGWTADGVEGYVDADTVFAADTTIIADWSKNSTSSNSGTKVDTSATTTTTTTTTTTDDDDAEDVTDETTDAEDVTEETTEAEDVTEETTEEETTEAEDTTEATLTAQESANLEATGYTDVAEDDWHAEAVQYVVESNLFQGTSSNGFSPETPMSREMTWVVLARLNGMEMSGATAYSDAKAWALENGITDGTAPSDSISREQLVTLLWRNAGSPEATGDLSAYDDAGATSDYAQDAMAWAIENGIISGMDASTLNPTGEATRAQVAQIMMNLG